MGGNLIDYRAPITTRMCDLVMFKMLNTSTLSQPKRKYFGFDVKNVYLNTPMQCPEYMKINLAQIPYDIISEYKLKGKVHTNGYVYIEIQKGMYRLPQASMLSNKLLK